MVSRTNKKRRKALLSGTKIKRNKDVAKSNTYPPVPERPKGAALSARALVRNGASPAQLTAWLEIVGQHTKVGLASHASCTALYECLRHSEAGLLQMLATRPDSSLNVQRFDFGHDSEVLPVRLDLKAAKRGLVSQLRIDYDDVWFVASPTLKGQRVGTSVFVFGLPSEVSARIGGRKLKPSTRIAPAAQMIGLQTAEDLRHALAVVWSPYAWLQLDADGLEEKPKYPDALAELECQVARVLLPIEKSMFGVGIGKKLAAGIARTIKARASLFDVAGLASLQPEAVPSFLASLPADRKGGQMQLPVVIGL